MSLPHELTELKAQVEAIQQTFGSLQGYHDAIMAAGNSLPGKNLIINGGMNVWQRATATTAMANNYSTVDRWRGFVNSSGTFTSEKKALSVSEVGITGQATSLRLDVTTAKAPLSGSEYAAVLQYIEAQNLQHLKFGSANARPLTLSFWVKSNKTGTYSITLVKPDSTVAYYKKAYTIDVADTWEKKVITVTPDAGGTNMITSAGGAIANDNGIGLYLTFGLAWGAAYHDADDRWNTSGWCTSQQVNWLDNTANYLEITGVQLEAQNVASPFDHQSYGEVLKKCQRYFYDVLGAVTSGYPILNVNAYSSNNNYGLLDFPVEMRAPPSLLYSAVGDFRGRMRNTATCTVINTQGTHSTKRVCMYFQSTSTAGEGGWIETNNSSAKLQFDSEL